MAYFHYVYFCKKCGSQKVVSLNESQEEPSFSCIDCGCQDIEFKLFREVGSGSTPYQEENKMENSDERQYFHIMAGDEDDFPDFAISDESYASVAWKKGISNIEGDEEGWPVQVFIRDNNRKIEAIRYLRAVINTLISNSESFGLPGKIEKESSDDDWGCY